MATKKKPTKTSESMVDVVIDPIDIQILPLTLIGTAPLVMHAWSAKAKQEMLAKQMKEAAKSREAKNPDQDFEDSIYRRPDGSFGFPAIAFKAAAVGASRNVVGITMTLLRGAFHIHEELVEIHGEPIRREDMVRVGQGTADIRYRAQFDPWYTQFNVHFNASVVTPTQLINLFNLAGFAVGVGEWRPQRNGQLGMFKVGTERDIARITGNKRSTKRGKKKTG